MGTCGCISPHYPCQTCGWGPTGRWSDSSTPLNPPITTLPSTTQWISPLPDASREIREDELECASILMLLRERVREKQPWRTDMMEKLRLLAGELFAGEEK